MSTTASQITGISIVYSTICSVLLTQHMGRIKHSWFLIPGADQRKYQSSASLTFERGIHRWPVDPTQRASNAAMYLFEDVMMSLVMIDHFKGQLLFKPCNIVFYHKNDPTYNIHGDFMQIYILHFRNSGVGSMELENALCCSIVDICI